MDRKRNKLKFYLGIFLPILFLILFITFHFLTILYYERKRFAFLLFNIEFNPHTILDLVMFTMIGILIAILFLWIENYINLLKISD